MEPDRKISAAPARLEEPDQLNPTVLSIPQAARRLGVGRSTLYNLIRDGKIPTRKLGRRTLILASDIDTLVASLPVGGGCDASE